MKKSMSKLLMLVIFIVCFISSYSEDNLTMEQLNDLKQKNMISQEDYDILISELNGTLDNEQLYKLSVNGMLIDDRFKVLMKGEEIFFPVLRFAEILGFINKKENEKEIELFFNSEIDVKIDKNKKLIKNHFNKIYDGKEFIIEEDGEYYLREDAFKEIFLESLNVDEKDFMVKMRLGFDTPEEVEILFKVRQEEIKSQLETNEILYTNSRELFDFGNMRIQLYENFNKQQGKKSYESDWEGNLEYQGAFLYGDLVTDYDLNKNELGNLEITYKNILKGHELNVGSYRAGKRERELGFSLKKDKGYYEIGKQIVIKEEVPIGSKVELIYMGYPIDVKEAEGGYVVFDSPLIKSDRSYQLKIYTPDGSVEVRNINTAQSYNQQNKGEVEYDISLREDSESNLYSWDYNLYYGLMDSLTVGLKDKRTPIKNKNGYRFLDEGRLEFVGSNNIFENNYPVTLRVGTDRTFTKGVNNSNKDFSDRYKYDGLFQLGIEDFKLKIEQEQYGKFYDEKYKGIYGVEYLGVPNFTLGYEHEQRYEWNNNKKEENRYKIDYDKGLTSNLLLSSEIKVSDKSEEEYRMDLFYTGFSDFNVGWKNMCRKKKENYETELELSSNSYNGILDYAFSVKYSENLKERVVLSFTIDYENFFKVSGRAGEKGGRNLRMGVDKVIDLKDVKAPMKGLDSSRVKVVTFIDENDNNKYDKGETRVDNVEVKIGDKVQITDENGETVFHGIQNGSTMKLNTTVRKPSYSTEKNVIKIKGISTSTIEAYIPIKPMLTLTGNLNLGKDFKGLKEEEIQELYGDIIIKIKDRYGREKDVTMPDETGEFIVSGLFPDSYSLEIKYLGERYKLPELKENLKLNYKNGENQEIELNMTKDGFSVEKKLEKIL